MSTATSNYEIFVCKARVVFGQDVVFFRVFPYFVEKHEKQEGIGGRAEG